MKLSNLIIAILFVSLAGTVLSMFMAKVTTDYGGTYDEGELSIYNNISETQSLIQNIQNKTEQDEISSGTTDILGSFLGDAVNALRIGKNSYTTYEAMANEGTEQLGLPPIFKIVITGALLISIIFIIISAMVKRDL